MSRPKNPAVWRMDEAQRAVTVSRLAGRWADVIVNLGRASSTDRDHVYTGEVIGYGWLNVGTVAGTVVLRELDHRIVVLSTSTVRRLVDRGPVAGDILPAGVETAEEAAGLVPLPLQ